MRIIFLLFSMTIYTMIWAQNTTTITEEKEISVSVSQEDGQERSVKIVTSDGGDEQVIEWSDDGEIPDEIQKKLKEMGIDIQSIGGSLHMDRSDFGKNKSMVIVEMDDEKRHMKPRHRKMKRKHMRGRAMRPERDIELSDAYMGAHVRSVDDGDGVEIIELVKDGPADKARLEQGDILLRINGARTKSMEGMLNLLNYFEPKDELELLISRGGKEVQKKLTLGTRPDHFKL